MTKWTNNEHMKTTNKFTNTPVIFLGIDVGKAELFCHLILANSSHSEKFRNTPTGIINLIKWLSIHADLNQILACMEHTGIYGKLVSKALFDAKVGGVFLVNPRRIKAYGNQKLRRNKSDTADAKLIANFLKSEYDDLLFWSPQSPDCEQITELSRHADSITKDTARLKTKCESISSKAILRSIKRTIKFLEKEIADIRKRINDLIKKNKDLVAMKSLLASIPGIGEITQQILIAELPDINLFKNARQLAAWAGLTPQHFESGTSGRTQTPITKIGSSILRKALFMPAMTARTNNPLLKEFGDRLQKNGKKPKQIIIAIMRKLLHQIYGILKSNQPFNPNKKGFIIAKNPEEICA